MTLLLRGGKGRGGGGLLAYTVRSLAAILKPVYLRFPTAVASCFYPWVILWQNFSKIGSPEGTLPLVLKQEVHKKLDIKYFILLKVAEIPRGDMILGHKTISRHEK